MTRVPKIITDTSRLLVSATGAVKNAVIRSGIDRYAIAGEHPSDEVNFDAVRAPVASDDVVLEEELASFNEPAIISSRDDTRPPIPYFTVVNSFGITYKGYLRPAPLAPLMGMLGWAGEVATHDDHCIYRIRDGRRIRINFTEGTTDRILKDIDFSLEGKAEDVVLPLARSFLAILQEYNAVSAVFKKNPYFEQEKAAYRRWHSNPNVFDPPRVSLKSLLVEPWKWDVLIIPDVHNHWDELELIEELLDRGRIDWIAAEMFRISQQPIIDRYLAAPGGTNSFENLKAELQDALVGHEQFQRRLGTRRARPASRSALSTGRESFVKMPSRAEMLWQGLRKIGRDVKRGWDTWLGDVGPRGPYVTMLMECRRRGRDLIGMNCERDYVLLNYTEREHVPWIMGGENSLWAAQVPTSGRGIVFGGLMHFTRFPGVRVQDFLHEMQPNRSIIKSPRF